MLEFYFKHLVNYVYVKWLDKTEELTNYISKKKTCYKNIQCDQSYV